MLSLFGLFVSAAIIPFVSAQNGSASAVDIEAIQAHFTQAGIVGPTSLLTSFDPTAILSVNFAGAGVITPGQAVAEADVQSPPTISVTAANSSVSLTGNFTLAMVDPGVVGTDDTAGVVRHWLVNDVTISGSTISVPQTEITVFAGPAPPVGSGPHRYTILLFSQGSTFAPPSEFSAPNEGVITDFNLTTYVSEANLGPLVAGMYFTVENGTSTVTIPTTSSVVSSTLAGFASASGTASGSAGSSAASAKPSSGASISAQISCMALVFGAVLTLMV